MKKILLFASIFLCFGTTMAAVNNSICNSVPTSCTLVGVVTGNVSSASPILSGYISGTRDTIYWTYSGTNSYSSTTAWKMSFSIISGSSAIEYLGAFMDGVYPVTNGAPLSPYNDDGTRDSRIRNNNCQILDSSKTLSTRQKVYRKFRENATPTFLLQDLKLYRCGQFATPISIYYNGTSVSFAGTEIYLAGMYGTPTTSGLSLYFNAYSYRTLLRSH